MDPPVASPVDAVAVAIESWRRTLAGSDAGGTLLATGPDATTSWLDLTQAHPSGLAQLFAGRPTRLSSLFRESASHTASRRRARAIRAAALELAAQRGLHGCCLAIGMATWRPASAELPSWWPAEDPVGVAPGPVLAPVVLRGCSVSPRGAGHEDYDLDLDDAVVVNPELVRVLVESYGIPADGAHLASLAHGPKGFDPRPVYAWLEERCGDLPGFRIDRSLVLATFSAGSGAVLDDLDAAVPAIAAHPLLAKVSAAVAPGLIVLPGTPAGLNGQAGPGAPQTAAGVAGARDGVTPAADSRRLAVVGRLGPRSAVRPVRPPDEPDPRDELLVLDLDPAQQQAVDAALRGDHVVIEGPPGSGATHALAAAVANLAAAGRRVLVVGPRRASVEALLARFEAAGISDLVLDVQDAAGARTSPGTAATTAALRRGLEAAANRPTTLLPPTALPEPGTGPGDAESGADAGEQPDPDAPRPNPRDQPPAVLRRARRLLNGAVAALHEARDPWGVTAYEAMVALAELSGRSASPGSRVRLSEEVLARFDAVTRERYRVHLHAAAGAGAFTLTRVDTRWFDARVTTDEEAKAALEAARTLRGGLERARGAMDAVTADAGLQPAANAQEWLPLLDVLLSVRATLDVMTPQVFEQPLDELVSATAPRGVRGNDGRTRRERRRLRKQAQAMVRPGVHVPDLHGALLGAQDYARQWKELSHEGDEPRAVVGLTEASVAVDRVSAALDVLASAFDGTGTPDPRLMPLDDLERRVFDLAGDVDGILGQPRRATLIAGLTATGLGEFVADLRARRVGPEAVDREFDLVWWSSVLDSIIRSDPRLADHDAEAYRQASEDLRVAEAAHIAAGAVKVGAAVLARAHAVLEAQPDQVRRLRTELHREDRPARPVDLVRAAPDVLAALCPVWVMSPDAVAACLPVPVPGGAPVVDVVAVDDAGHVALPEVAAVLARGRQVVLAGDRRRQSVPAGGPSLVGAVAPFATVCHLDRDHRTHDGRILVPLAPRYLEGWQLTPGVAVAPPLRLEPVTDGVAIPPPGEEVPLSADAEVRRVVDLVAAHAARHPEESLVVATFSDRHADRIEAALRAEVSERPGLARWLAERWRDGSPEPLLIRTADRLLGVERDAAIVAIGLARTPHGRVLHRFDVLDGDSGAAHLITAMSRARRRTTVVSCFSADDLVVDRLRSDGARLLRDVLLAAGGRGAASAGRSSTASVDGLVADLRDRLATAGLPVRSRVGDGAWPLDIAVADPRSPGRMIVAVDLDGPAFASRPSRERERQRPERWERAGWTYVKVSALDLFRDAAREVERIRTAWQRALVEIEDGGQDQGSAPGESDRGRPPVPPRRDPRPRDREPVIPQQTGDDTDVGWGEVPVDDEDYLQRERPPHWE